MTEPLATNEAAPPATQEHHIRTTRHGRFFTLGPADERAREVWFVLHGYGNLAQRFLRYFSPLDDGTRLIVAPEALNRFYLVPPEGASAKDRLVGASWMTKEDRQNEIDDYVRYLDAVADAVSARARRTVGVMTVVVGFSQGSATAARWVTTGRIRPRHLILWGGMLPPELELHRADHPLRQLSLRFVIGSDDGFATPALIGEQESRLRDARLPYELERFDGGHAIDAKPLRSIAASISAR